MIDYDVPLEAFDGMTAFMATQTYGYPCHETQQYTWFTDWINGKTTPITKATEIKSYNPSHFGLYRSTVGEDVLKNDFMENITSYEEQARLEAERLEQERLEAERLEKERLEAERLEQEAKKMPPLLKILLGGLLVLVMVLCLVVATLLIHSGKKYRGGKYSKKR